jgi:hypothetical protein
VGVVGNLKHTYTDDPLPRVYVIGDTTSFVVRTAGDPETVLPAIRPALAEVDLPSS